MRADYSDRDELWTVDEVAAYCKVPQWLALEVRRGCSGRGGGLLVFVAFDAGQ